jgi:hypothetical protein
MSGCRQHARVEVRACAMRLAMLLRSGLGSLAGHPPLLIAVTILLAISDAHPSSADPPTRAFDPIRLAQGQSLAYCGLGSRIQLGPGDTVLLGCRNDSLTLDGRALELESFPSNRICELSAMRQLFGTVPRIMELTRGVRSNPPDTSAWYDAVGKYAAEVRSVFEGTSGQNADSLLDLWPLNRLPPHPHYDTVVDLWAQLRWQRDPAAEYPEIAWTNLKGLAIPFTQGFQFRCAAGESLSTYLAEATRSGKPFHLELGSGLLFWGSK